MTKKMNQINNYLLLLLLAVISTTSLNAQVKVGTNPTTINATTTTFQVEGTASNNQFVILKNGNVGAGTLAPNAALDINSTTSGILVPRYTTAARKALTLTAAQDGLIVYDTDVDCIFSYAHSTTTPTWVSYCKVPFTIYAHSDEYTYLGLKGATFLAYALNTKYLPLTWAIESFSGDISNVTIAANSPTTTSTITYDVPDTTINKGNALIVIKATDSIGQIQYTTINLITSKVISETPLACNGDLQTNNPTLVASKMSLFAKTSTADAYRTFISPGNTGNVNVTATGDSVSVLRDPSTNGLLSTWTTSTGAVTVRRPKFTLSNPTFNGNPTLTFSSAKRDALGVVTSNTSGGPFKLVFLASTTTTNGTNTCVLSAIPSSSLGAAGATLSGSWQVSRDDANDILIYRSADGFVSKNLETQSCPSCGTSEVAFTTWSAFADGKPHLVVVDYDGSTLKGYFDGALKFEITPNATQAPTGEQFRIGANRNASNFIDMQFAELIIGNSSLTTPELITIQGYFLCKYGLDASLLAYASPFAISNAFYNNPSQFVLQIDQVGNESVYDKINNKYYMKSNTPSPGLGYFKSPEIKTIQSDYIINIQPGSSANQLIITRGDGSSFTVTVP